MSRTEGCPRRARARTTRCRCPADRVLTGLSALPASWTSARRALDSVTRTLLGTPRIPAKRTRFWRAVNRHQRLLSLTRATPTRERTSKLFTDGSNPSTQTSPPSRVRVVDKIRSRVVLPAPLEPTSTETAPAGASKSTGPRTLEPPSDLMTLRTTTPVETVLPVAEVAGSTAFRTFAHPRAGW